MLSTRHIAFPVALLFVAACSAGNLPTRDGALPSLDGSKLTGVSASSVGGVSADTIAAGLQTVSAATDDATAGAMVKRNSSGDFSAHVITATLQGFATGKRGAPITVAGSTLTFGGDGNFFEVNGSGNVTQIAPMDAGTRITVRFTSVLTLHHDATRLALQGNGDFRTASGNIFEFLSLGFGNWIEVSRTVTNDSSVLVTLSTGATMTSTVYFYPHYDSITRDNQGEYNAAGGYFVAHQSGRYHVTAQFISNGANFAAGDFCQTSLEANTVNASEFGRTLPPPGMVIQCIAVVSQVLTLSAGETVRPSFYIYSAAPSLGIPSAPGNDILNFMRIDRLRN